MIDLKEINRLADALNAVAGVTCTVRLDRDGYVDTIAVAGARGIGPYPMGPISFGERAREFLGNLAKADQLATMAAAPANSLAAYWAGSATASVAHHTRRGAVRRVKR